MEKKSEKGFFFHWFFLRTHNPPSTSESPCSNMHYPRQLSFFWLKGEDERLKKERKTLLNCLYSLHHNNRAVKNLSKAKGVVETTRKCLQINKVINFEGHCLTQPFTAGLVTLQPFCSRKNITLKVVLQFCWKLQTSHENFLFRRVSSEI